jgi:MFS family permease
LSVVADIRSRAGVFPRPYWLLVTGTFIYLVGYECGFPLETIYLHGGLGLSMTAVGLILGLCGLAGLPVQLVGGAVADRFGRRPVLIVAILASMTLFLGLALTQVLWQVVAVIAVEAAFGWAMYLTASNAIIGDVTTVARRAEAYGIGRVANSAGIVVGPLIGSLILRHGGGYRLSFLVGGAVMGIFLVIATRWLPETRPAAAKHEHDGGAGGYRVVLRDRRFLLFCAVTLLPLYCHGQFLMTFPVLLKSVVGIPPSR